MWAKIPLKLKILYLDTGRASARANNDNAVFQLQHTVATVHLIGNKNKLNKEANF